MQTLAHAPGTSGSRRFLAWTGPFAFLGGFFLLALTIQGLARLLLTLSFHQRVDSEPGTWRLFPLGLRMDVVTACYLLALPALFLLLGPRALVARTRRVAGAYFACAVTLMVVMEAVTLDFIEQYDIRPNRLFIEYLGSSEVIGTIWTRYRLNLLLALAVSAGAAFGAARLGCWLARGVGLWSSPRRAMALLLAAPLIFLGIRGTFQHRPINAAMVAFSGNNLLNQLALNSTYTVAKAWVDQRHERPPSALYGRMPEHELLARVEKYTGIEPQAVVASDIPFLHRQEPRQVLARPRNFVIVLEESLGAEFVGSLGGLPLTPNLDALAREGLYFTRLFCTGTRTVRGIEAVVSGFLPTPGSSVVKLSRSQSDFFTVAGLLRQHGYATDFVYGGEGHFDNMAAFFLANGFERAWNQSDFEDPAFRGTWGVSDEDLMRKAHEIFLGHGDRPFFTLVLSTSNHSPFEFPDGRIELHDPEKATRNNTVKYADYAIGELFRLAKGAPYWKDTLWLVVADHDERTYGDQLVPVDKFHIPGLLLGPGVTPGTFERVASQVDLVPTALDLLGLELVHPMIGRNLFALPDDDPGRAIMQFNDIHGFLVGDRLAVLPGGGKPRCFRVRDWRLEPMTDDLELLRDGLAHALLPGLLYEQGRYRLPALDVTPRPRTAASR